MRYGQLLYVEHWSPILQKAKIFVAFPREMLLCKDGASWKLFTICRHVIELQTLCTFRREGASLLRFQADSGSTVESSGSVECCLAQFCAQTERFCLSTANPRARSSVWMALGWVDAFHNYTLGRAIFMLGEIERNVISFQEPLQIEVIFLWGNVICCGSFNSVGCEARIGRSNSCLVWLHLGNDDGYLWEEFSVWAELGIGSYYALS